MCEDSLNFRKDSSQALKSTPSLKRIALKRINVVLCTVSFRLRRHNELEAAHICAKQLHTGHVFQLPTISVAIEQ